MNGMKMRQISFSRNSLRMINRISLRQDRTVLQKIRSDWFLDFSHTSNSLITSKRKVPTSQIRTDRNAVVTIEEINDVTFVRLKKSGMKLHYSQSFLTLMRSEEMNKLLLRFIHYFDTYFYILEFKEKFSNNNLMPTRSQIQDQKQRRDQLNSLRYELAVTYAEFILLERQTYASKQRIMYRPVDPATETIHDQKLFEAIYWFLVFGVWITFDRHHFKDICTEIGDFTRSDMFNSLGRMGAARFSKNVGENQLMKDLYKTNLPRDLMSNQRSPALRLLIPEPRDRVGTLLQSLNTKYVDAARRQEASVQSDNQRYGILGDARYLYDDQLIANSTENATEQAGTSSQQDI
ncbi:hypothetical protein D915_005789 [Fasciola hepatica]|uniref:Protein phosphatase 1 regulatory subunit 36 n=1 Tax=Fasciola hepatica TaxID=6192 RepID=A0A4E0RSG4_FASHE|nr:hypothetical protein D915_005789 [Fasciola hepatica]